jgi:uncharacterized protein
LADALVWLGLVLLGIGVGAYGTLIGAGGGFLLTPILLILYPDKAPELITAIALCAVFFNAASGSIAYGRQKRIDYLVAFTFAITEVPGAMVGALTTGLFPRDVFEALFGIMLLAVALALVRRPGSPVVTPGRSRGSLSRLHSDAHGDTYAYRFNPVHAALIGLAIGFVSSTFGVGGGFIYVPAMVLLMRFPAYIATATSTFALMFAAAGATGVHAVEGHYAGSLPETASLTVGVVIGAQVGAVVSARLGRRSQVVVTRLLSVALVVVGIRLLVGVVV